MTARRSRTRYVVDTNVWISSALSQQGTPAVLRRLIVQTGRPVFSDSTFSELEERLWWPKFDRYLSRERRISILDELNSAGLWVEIPESISVRRYSRDPDDDKFIWTALAAEASYLVTGDGDLLDVPPIPGLSILTPAAALKVFQTR